MIEEQIGGDTTVQYLWSPVYVDSMILRDRDADANTSNGFESRGLEERIYVLHDANYNVTAITDDSGDVLERYYYEAYGQPVYLDENFNLLADAESQYAWQHLHQGGRLDAITGNYHFRNRDLSPTLGRWISQDPIGFEAGDMSFYRYLGNRPINFLDPSGLITGWGNNPAGWWDPSAVGTTVELDDPDAGMACLGLMGMVFEPLDYAMGCVGVAIEPDDPWNYTFLAPVLSAGMVRAIRTIKTTKGARTPTTDTPDSTIIIDYGNNEGTIREFGPNGKALNDYDFGHDHGAGDPHAHDWDWTQNPARQPGRPLNPGE